jgi:cell division protein FtsB
MKRLRSEPKLQKESVTQGVALACLLLLGGLAIAGPSGILSWSEHRRLLDERQDQIKLLTAERDAVKNRVARLDPRHVDPDLAGELLRSNLNVVHPDEMVMLLK